MRIPKPIDLLLAGSLWLCGAVLCAQVAPDCGQAVPICSNTPVNGGTTGYGIDDFGGAAASGCLERTTSGYIESNSAWYRFRTGASGQLGFNIAFDASEDWDFALYRASDCNTLGDPVRCNFYDNQEGASYMGVGEDPTGNTESYQYEPWLDVQAGEDYYLLINNFSNTNSGFSIQFSGQIFTDAPNTALDCSIVSNLLGPPVAACQGDTVPLDAFTPTATAYAWFLDAGSGFLPLSGETNPTLNATQAGMYRVQVFMPDGSQIISDVQVGFSPVPYTNPLADLFYCDQGQGLNLHQLDAAALGVQAPSEFRVSYYTDPSDAGADRNPLPGLWEPAAGMYTVYVRTTSLANPICYDVSVSFQVTSAAQPLLDFPEEAFICGDGTAVTIGQATAEPGVEYLWDHGPTGPEVQVNAPGTYTLTARAGGSGSGCETVRSVQVQVSTPPGIGSILLEDVQANNRITVVPVAEGDFRYALDNGPFQESPVFEGVTPGTHQLTMRDALGCGQVTETITVVGFLPFFTPNGDGINDLWHVQGLEQLEAPVVFIFDRFGKLLKQLDQSSPGWDGTFNGVNLPDSDYWFRLEYTDPRGQRIQDQFLQAHFALKR
ncbi:T9SS type B sorting domain-containing protein [Robiginitalea sp. M366]|uniref:T9SS type B sorting domain-containing protein n=1 Tax=Robiginitalea aestuariiviva TaxID=3036903 RepID=UPI00240CEC21|nr:T9SS type B sorting domain-containing protein [Robiginitalea aestuariiviva]MDG1572222.1 T9SS type B sorting domain-containing protein [Robiginitalea aestuariiviva]